MCTFAIKSLWYPLSNIKSMSVDDECVSKLEHVIISADHKSFSWIQKAAWHADVQLEVSWDSVKESRGCAKYFNKSNKTVLWIWSQYWLQYYNSISRTNITTPFQVVKCYTSLNTISGDFHGSNTCFRFSVFPKMITSLRWSKHNFPNSYPNLTETCQYSGFESFGRQLESV